MYISSSLSSEFILRRVYAMHFECVFIKLILCENKQLIIGNTYRPPVYSSDSTKCILSTITILGCSKEIIILVISTVIARLFIS